MTWKGQPSRIILIQKAALSTVYVQICSILSAACIVLRITD